MELLVTVRYRYGTYAAALGSQHRASCTAGARQAVERLAEKVFGSLQRVTCAEAERGYHHNTSFWRIKTDPTQSCRVCGCTWDAACSGGCFWVEEDLCSHCGSAA